MNSFLSGINKNDCGSPTEFHTSFLILEFKCSQTLPQMYTKYIQHTVLSNTCTYIFHCWLIAKETKNSMFSNEIITSNELTLHTTRQYSHVKTHVSLACLTKKLTQSKRLKIWLYHSTGHAKKCYFTQPTPPLKLQRVKLP